MLLSLGPVEAQTLFFLVPQLGVGGRLTSGLRLLSLLLPEAMVMSKGNRLLFLRDDDNASSSSKVGIVNSSRPTRVPNVKVGLGDFLLRYGEEGKGRI